MTLSPNASRTNGDEMIPRIPAQATADDVLDVLGISRGVRADVIRTGAREPISALVRQTGEDQAGVTAPVVRLGTNGTAPGRMLWLWCPGCNDSHAVGIESPTGWTWDGNETAPTINPSILTWRDWGDKRRCHSFIRAGRWEFLADCTHALAGQTVPMVALPDWLNDDYVGGAA